MLLPFLLLKYAQNALFLLKNKVKCAKGSAPLSPYLQRLGFSIRSQAFDGLGFALRLPILASNYELLTYTQLLVLMMQQTFYVFIIIGVNEKNFF